MSVLRLGAAVASAAFVASAVAVAPARAASPAIHIRGTIAAHSATGIDVTTASGVVHVALAAKTGYLAVLPSSRDAIKPRTFVGIASVGDAPGARAREVVVFPDALRGTGEGHYAWDLPGGGNRMTNGTVLAPRSMMTNGTVAHLAASGGPLTLEVAYKGGTSRIVVPPTAPIVALAPATAAIVVTGAHVVVFATSAGGASTARAVLVGKDGLTPPM